MVVSHSSNTQKRLFLLQVSRALFKYAQAPWRFSFSQTSMVMDVKAAPSLGVASAVLALKSVGLALLSPERARRGSKVHRSWECMIVKYRLGGVR
jgi:hypothetical protein